MGRTLCEVLPRGWSEAGKGTPGVHTPHAQVEDVLRRLEAQDGSGRRPWQVGAAATAEIETHRYGINPLCVCIARMKVVPRAGRVEVRLGTNASWRRHLTGESP